MKPSETNYYRQGFVDACMRAGMEKSAAYILYKEALAGEVRALARTGLFKRFGNLFSAAGRAKNKAISAARSQVASRNADAAVLRKARMAEQASGSVNANRELANMRGEIARRGAARRAIVQPTATIPKPVTQPAAKVPVRGNIQNRGMMSDEFVPKVRSGPRAGVNPAAKPAVTPTAKPAAGAPTAGAPTAGTPASAAPATPGPGTRQKIAPLEAPAQPGATTTGPAASASAQPSAGAAAAPSAPAAPSPAVSAARTGADLRNKALPYLATGAGAMYIGYNRGKNSERDDW